MNRSTYESMRRLRRPGVVDRMVFDILRQALPAVDALLQFRVCDIACDNHRTGQRQAGLDRILRQARADLAHRSREVDLYHLAAELRLVDVREVLRRIRLELFEEDALARDLGSRLPVGRARHADADG